MAERTAIVIVNWNGASFLPALLESVEESACKEIIVVDNASTDDSLSVVSRFPSVRVIANQSNLGYGNASNQGIEAAHADYVLLLNADTRLLPGSVQRLESFLNEKNDVAVAAPQLLFPDGRLQPSVRKFPTILNLFLFLSYLDRFIPSGYRVSEKGHSELQEVEQPMGAALMFRKSALKESGLFDREFFLYMEEVDLCKRIKEAGWKIYYVPESQVIHHAGGSSKQDWERSQRNFFSSLIHYFRKHHRSRLKILMLKSSLSIALLIRSMILLLSRRKTESNFYAGMILQIWSLNG
jgi:GT2 family glycosyltransferase